MPPTPTPPGRSGSGREEAGSPIGRYAAGLALLVVGRWPAAASVTASLQGRDDFPPAVADALAAIADGDATALASRGRGRPLLLRGA